MDACVLTIGSETQHLVSCTGCLRWEELLSKETAARTKNRSEARKIHSATNNYIKIRSFHLGQVGSKLTVLCDEKYRKLAYQAKVLYY